MKNEPAITSNIPQLGGETAEPVEARTGDGVVHFGRLWQAAHPGPLVIHLHGIEGHSRWFETTALRLKDAGISTVALDRRGAGLSKETRGDIAACGRLVADVVELVEQLRSTVPHTSLFLIGNCWGGKLAVVAAQHLAGKLDGLVLTSPALSTQVDVSLTTKLKIGLSYVLGGKALFDIPLTPEHFTDNPPYLMYVAEDKLRLKQASARFFVESLKLTAACRKAIKQLRLPTLVLQSGKDAIVDLPAIKRWFDCLGSGDKTLKIFTSAAHSLDFEADQAQYQAYLQDWIETRSSNKRALAYQ